MLIKKKGHPNIAQVIREMAKAEASDPRDAGGHAHRQADARHDPDRGRQCRFSRRPTTPSTSSMPRRSTPPLGSGAYKVGRRRAPGATSSTNASTTTGAGNLPVNAGQNNFDVIRIDFFTERQTAFEAFKKGEITLPRGVHLDHLGAGLQFPGDVQAEGQEVAVPGRAATASARAGSSIRGARSSPTRGRGWRSALAFDFEWSNRNLFFDTYDAPDVAISRSRTSRAIGHAEPEELELLEPFRAELPPEVFGEAYVPPKTDGSGTRPQAPAAGVGPLARRGLEADRQPDRRRGGRAAGDRVPDRCGSLRARPRALSSPTFELIGIEA